MMLSPEWFLPVDAYCERTGPDYWSEPVNALTNLAFVAAAVLVWPRVRAYPTGRVLAVMLGVIGVGSWLFHTHANRLTGLMDVLPILAFILAYVFVATRDYFGARRWIAAVVALGFLPYAALLVPLFRMVPGLGSSAAYAPVPVLIFAYAWFLRRRLPPVARGLAIGAAVLVVSLTFRSLDGPVCGAVPLGTHFLWHLLNAVMLGWMILVWAGWRAAGPGRK